MPLPVAERLREELAEHDAHVFDGVVLVHVEIALRLQLEVEAAVLGEQLQHVVEKADAGGDLVAALPSIFRCRGSASLWSRVEWWRVRMSEHAPPI